MRQSLRIFAQLSNNRELSNNESDAFAIISRRMNEQVSHLIYFPLMRGLMGSSSVPSFQRHHRGRILEICQKPRNSSCIASGILIEQQNQETIGMMRSYVNPCRFGKRKQLGSSLGFSSHQSEFARLGEDIFEGHLRGMY